MDKEYDSWVDELLEKDMENGTIPDNTAPIFPPEFKKEVITHDHRRKTNRP